jgi:DNA invertase Pin-like site-specific DNA recombinase
MRCVAGMTSWMVWSIDRLGRSVLHVANALAELDAAGIRLYCDREGIDSSTPMGRAMIQMASVFGEQERSMLRSRVLAGLERVRQQGKRLGRPRCRRRWRTLSGRI